MNKLVFGILAALTLLPALIPTAAAHPAAVVVDAGSGTRCYVYENFDVPQVEFWLETNGITSGGVPTVQDYVAAAPGEPSSGSSGLQRGGANHDTMVSPDAWLQACAPLA